jgi:hypothetical protein
MSNNNLVAEPFLEHSTGDEIKTSKPFSKEGKANQPSAGKARTWGQKLKKVLVVTVIALLAVYFVGRLVWRFSGSNRWELIGDKNGVKVYSLKAPGSDIKQFKSVFRIHSTLAGLVKYFQDSDACKDVGCINAHELERVDDELQYAYFEYKLPFPFQPREFVVRQQFHQNPRTKEILAEYVAAPDKAPPNDCCFRITEMNNRWRLTPLGSGEVELEYIMDMNDGGFVPDILANTQRPKLFFNFMKLQGWVSKEKYQTAKFDFVQEK